MHLSKCAKTKESAHHERRVHECLAFRRNSNSEQQRRSYFFFFSRGITQVTVQLTNFGRVAFLMTFLKGCFKSAKRAGRATFRFAKGPNGSKPRSPVVEGSRRSTSFHHICNSRSCPVVHACRHVRFASLPWKSSCCFIPSRQRASPSSF